MHPLPSQPPKPEQVEIPETHKADWNQQQPQAQLKETNPIDRVAQNQEVKLQHSRLMTDVDELGKKKRLQEYDRKHDPVSENQRAKLARANLLDELDQVGKERRWQLYQAKHDMVAENQKLKAARAKLLTEVEKAEKPK